MAEARDNGTPIKVLSPFRGYKQQVAPFYDYAGRNLSNFESAITYSARPGHSEHQTGLTIDFGSLGDTGLSSTWESTPAGGWMARNAWEYGWLMSYPTARRTPSAIATSRGTTGTSVARWRPPSTIPGSRSGSISGPITPRSIPRVSASRRRG